MVFIGKHYYTLTVKIHDKKVIILQFLSKEIFFNLRTFTLKYIFQHFFTFSKKKVLSN